MASRRTGRDAVVQCLSEPGPLRAKVDLDDSVVADIEVPLQHPPSIANGACARVLTSHCSPGHPKRPERKPAEAALRASELMRLTTYR